MSVKAGQAQKAEAKRAEREAEIDRIRKCMKLLERAGVEPTPRWERRERIVKTKLGFKRKESYVHQFAPAWPIGNVNWEYSEGHMHGKGVSPIPSGVTPKLKVQPMSGPPRGLTIEGFNPRQLEGDLGRGDLRRQVLDALERLIREAG
jgi:hypothetical protein